MAAAGEEPTAPRILLSPPAGEVKWTIDYSYERSRGSIIEEKQEDLASEAIELADLNRPEKIDFLIKDPISTMTTRYEEGARDEGYFFDDYEFRTSRRSAEVLVFDLNSYPQVEQLFRSRFPGVHWVTPDFFVKMEEAHGEPCAYFRDETPATPDPEVMDEILDSSKHDVREAWFSARSGLPVAFKSGETTGRFTFEPARAAEISVPSKIREKISEFARYQAYLEKRAQPEEGAARR